MVGMNSEMEDYLLNNYIAMEVGYLDNVQVEGVEFFLPHTAILFKNDCVDFNSQATCINGMAPTHSLYNGQFNNIIFNHPRFAMRVENSNTLVRGQFSNVIAQGPEANFGQGVEDTLFSLRSDFVDLQFSNLYIPTTGGSLMEVGSGSGSGSLVMIDGARVKDFSSLGTPRSAFIIYKGAEFKIGTNDIQSTKGFSAINNQN
jgi:hypothetical protein